MRISLARLLHTVAAAALLGMGLGPAIAAPAETRRAEELEQLRINTAYIIEAGEFEIDVVPSYFDYGNWQQQGVEIELEYALSERMMVEVEIPYYWLHFDGPAPGVSGAGNIEVAAKWMLAERGGFAISFNAGVELPASKDRPKIAEDSWGTELTLPMSLYFPERHVRLHIEPGVGWQEHEGFEEQLLNIAVEHRPNGGNLALQLGSNFVRESGEVEGYLVPAFEISAADSAFQFGMAVAAGVTSESAHWGVLLDFEIEFQ
jgi:hypothetical protein